MNHTKFTLLHEPIATTTASAPDLLCRVVPTKTAPLLSSVPVSAPVSAITTTIPLPSFLHTAHAQAVAAPLLARLLRPPCPCCRCHLVRRHLVPDPALLFHRLVATSDLYARTLRDLLDASPARHAYLVTGFLTAAFVPAAAQSSSSPPSSPWLMDATTPSPYSDTLSSPGSVGSVAQLYHPQQQQQQQQHPPFANQELIFAVSYRLVTNPIASSPIYSSPAPTSPPPRQRPKRTNAYHLASRSRVDNAPTSHRRNSSSSGSNTSSPGVVAAATATATATAPASAASPTLASWHHGVRLEEHDGSALYMEETPFVIV